MTHFSVLYLFLDPLEIDTPGWQIHEAISPRAYDQVIQKTTPDSFHETILEQYLTDLYIDHLILAGIQTEACVNTTCRVGFSKKYKITLAADAHSTFAKQEISV
ncbi:isochorismatase family protein [Sediminibacillus albus]|uniref:isochorismatase family protein n=1 Tax=Sediminibacillus albus TaxID=407036 RepID=UPI000B8513F4|nr:isochorismatase family protein [Sediminibacillus albus]